MEDIVLIHGLGRSSLLMSEMAIYWKWHGWRILNIDYPSTRYSIDQLVERISDKISVFRENSANPFFAVGHSLGSIILHFYIKKYIPAHLSRIVALGPPYHGSAIVDHLKRYPWFKKLYGPAAAELNSHLFARLGEVDYQLGVIAGNRCVASDWFFANFWLKKPNDGKVEVASTRIPNMKDHIILPVKHPLMPTYPSVIHHTAHFIHHGCFDHARLGY
ncbi:MAG: alpha/beta hydrolase [Proteobacteria bacterium]|nr:alpha/beta hydrolase [Pseudomonadota bacterium]